MVSVRSATRPHEEFDLTPPPPPPLWPRITVLIGVLVIGIGLVSWLALKPSPCDGKFSSDQFAYCIQVPSGWHQEPASIGPLSVDQFVRTDEALVVVVAFSLQPGTELKGYARIARIHARDAGLSAGESVESRLGNTPALEWDLHSTDSLLNYQGLEVVAVTGDVGWTIQLDASRLSFPRHVQAFRTMLHSWHFR
jgi:hypothetical protein